MKLTTILITAALAGCATSPQEVIDRGTKFTGTIAGTPSEAARCIAKNAEYTSGAMLAGVSEIDAQNTELIIRGTIEVTTSLSVWRFRKANSGSTYEAWVSPSLVVSPERHIQRVRGNC